MGASFNQFFIASESLESRRLLSAAVIEAAPPSVPTSVIFIAPAIHFSGTAKIENVVGTVNWGQIQAARVQGAVGTPGVTSTVTVNVISGSNLNGVADVEDSGQAIQNSADEANAEREAYLAALAAANGGTVAVPPGSNQPTGTGNGSGGGASHGHGNGKGVQPGDQHPGDSGPGTDPSGSDGGSGDASGGSGDASGGSGAGGSTGNSSGSGSGGSQHAHPVEGHLLASTVVESAGAQTSDSDASRRAPEVSIAAVGDKPTSGLTQSAYSSVEMIVKPLANATFSILPLAIAEFSGSLTSADPMSAPSLSQELARAIGQSPATAAVLNVVHSMIVEQAAPAASLVNLFHVDALATFSDTMEAFIDESAAPTMNQEVSPHSRAWKITAGVVAADAVLIGSWLGTRQREESARQARTRSTRFGVLGDGALAPR